MLDQCASVAGIDCSTVIHDYNTTYHVKEIFCPFSFNGLEAARTNASRFSPNP